MKLAELFVEIAGNMRPLHHTLGNARAEVETFSRIAQKKLGMGSLLIGAGLAAGTAVAGLAVATKKSLSFNETVNKTKEVFGAMTDSVMAEADQMAERFGYPKREFLDAASSIGLIGQAAGLSGPAVAEMGINFAKMAADATSFYNVPLEESLRAIRSGLVGEAEPMRRFGVLLDEEQVKIEAARMGLARYGAELTVQQKTIARASLIQKGLATATGDLARTSSSGENQIRQLWGRIENGLTALGQAFVPTFERMMTSVNAFASGLEGFASRAQPVLQGWAERAAEAFMAVKWASGEVITAVQGHLARLQAEVSSWTTITSTISAAWQYLKDVASEIFETIGVVFRNASLIAEETGVRMMQWAINVQEAFTWAGDAAKIWANFIANNWRGLAVDAFNAVWTAAMNFGTNIKNLFSALWEYLADPSKGFRFDWTPLLDGFKGVVAEFPKITAPVFTRLDEDIEAIRDKMRAVEAGRLEARGAGQGALLGQAALAALQGGAAGAAAGGRGGAAGGSGAAPHREGSRSMFSSLEDFAKRFQEGALGKEDAAKKTAEGVQQLVGLQQQGIQLQKQAIQKQQNGAVWAPPA